MTATATRAKHETWVDWGADDNPDHWITRAQLIKYLASRRVSVTENELRYWESLGILPRPVRRWHEGAVRALYHLQAASLIQHIRYMQREGLDLEQIKPRIRASFRLAVSGDEIDREIRQNTSAGATGPEDLQLTDRLQTEMWRLARWSERMYGMPPSRVVITVEWPNGYRVSHPIVTEESDIPEPTEETVENMD